MLFRSPVASEALQQIVFRRVLSTEFTRALADPTITAWVAANDDVAVPALEFLRERGVNVPQQISVVGFDDSVNALANQLTSYNINLPAILSASLRHILRTAPRQTATRAKIVRIDGTAVERAATGPARRRK